MNRRKAFAVAGAVSATAMGAVVALGANFGLFGLATANPDRAGQVRLVDPAGTGPATTVGGTGVEVQTVYVDQAPVSSFTDSGVRITFRPPDNSPATGKPSGGGGGEHDHRTEDD